MRYQPAGWIMMIGLLLICPTNESSGCTCFSLERDAGVLVGRNYDWDFSDGLVLVNKRNVKKPYGVFSRGSDAGWSSKYGSVTFNQYGRDFPQGGINEMGLVIEILWLNGTVFPPDDDRIDLGSTQWIQYQLDMSASVAEVLESFDRVQVLGEVEIHYFLTDRSGAAASIEFLEGKRVVHVSGESMPATVLTNHSYSRSKEYLLGHKGWGGSNDAPQSTRSLDRFVRAASLKLELDKKSREVESVFQILDAVSQGEHTQWSIVYDPNRLRVHFKTQRCRAVKRIDFDALDFACTSPVLMVDIDSDGAGSLADRWEEYTRDANLGLIKRSFGKTSFLQQISEEALGVIASHPDRSICSP